MDLGYRNGIQVIFLKVFLKTILKLDWVRWYGKMDYVTQDNGIMDSPMVMVLWKILMEVFIKEFLKIIYLKIKYIIKHHIKFD